MKLFVGYSKAPEQPQSSDRNICQSHTMTSTGLEPATTRIAAYTCWSSQRSALHHGRRHIEGREEKREGYGWMDRGMGDRGWREG